MNFRKTARDKNNKFIQEGDILLHFVNKESTPVVVTKLISHGREEFPTLKVKRITAGFLGKNLKVEDMTLTFETYRKCEVTLPENLRDDVPIFKRAKELREKVMEL